MKQTLNQHIFMKLVLEQYLAIKEEEFRKQRKEMFETLNAAKAYGKVGMRLIYNPIQLADKSFERDSSSINNLLEQLEKNIAALRKIALTETMLKELKEEMYYFYISKLLVKHIFIIEYVATYLFENNKFPIEVTRTNESVADKEQINKINSLETLSEEQKMYYTTLLTYIKPTSKTKKYE